MLKKHSIKKNKNNINLIIGRNAYTDYNNYNNLKHKKYSIQEKINSINNNNNTNNKKNLNSFNESPIQNKNSLYFDTKNIFGISYQTQTYNNQRINLSPQLNATKSTDLSHIKIKNTSEILKNLRKIILKIKNKNKKKSNDLYVKIPKLIIRKNFSEKNALKNEPKNKGYPQKYFKTMPKFEFNKNILNLDDNEKNKNKYKELRFKVHNTIKSNIHPLCNNYINKAHLFNEKILEYYQSDHYINLIRNFQSKFHYKLNLENHPKIKMYTDIKTLEKDSKTNKLDFKKCFSEKEQKLILLDPAYYFQKDNPDSFINVNIAKKKSLADRIKEEEEEQQITDILSNFINKKNSEKTRNITIGFDDPYSKRKLMSKVNKILNYNKKNKIDSKKLKNLEIKNLQTVENKEEATEFKKDEKYDFFKAYKSYVKEAYSYASQLNMIEEKKYNKKKAFNNNIDNKMRKCIIQLDFISKDKVLQKRAKENLYYDKAKDEKNKFNIVTKQMLVEQNYEHLSKIGRKIKINKNEINKNKETDNNKKENEKENIENNEKKLKKSKEKENTNDLSDNREKKLINLQINKIKLIYKNQ